MDNSNYFNNRHNDHLGVNKIGKNIRKSPSPQPNFVNPARPQHQPHVYNINKNDFRNIVQQLTGSPSRHSQEPPRPRLPQNSPNPASMRLQRIRPPGLAPININRPQMPVRPGLQMPPRGPISFNNNNNNLVRPAQYGQPRLLPMVPPPMPSGDHRWRQNTADSPTSAYMRYLQHSITESPNQSQLQSQQQPSPGLQPSPGFLPYSPVPPLPSPIINHPPPPFPSGPSPRMNGPPPPPIPPSPTSPFFLASPSGYLSFLSPLSPYPLLSPAYQNPPPPLTPLFSFSPVGQSQTGILGPGPHPPPSPGMGFPLSPGFFQIPTPRWRD